MHHCKTFFENIPTTNFSILFLQADPKLLEAVEGLQPDPQKHQFYMDIQPVIIYYLTVNDWKLTRI